jgi:hypothetical protein
VLNSVSWPVFPSAVWIVPCPDRGRSAQPPDLCLLMVTPRQQMPIRGLSRQQASACSACLAELRLLPTKWASLIRDRPLPGLCFARLFARLGFGTPWIWNDHGTITFPARAIIFPVLTWLSDLSDVSAKSEGSRMMRLHSGVPSGRLTNSNMATWVFSSQDSSVSPQTLQFA